MMRKSEGVAIVQVLLLVSLMSIFALAITMDVRKQIVLAQSYKDRSRAQLDAKIIESELLFSLLSKSKQDFREIYNANFYGKPFTFSDNVIVTIQDQAGLLDLYSLTENSIYELFLTEYESSLAATYARSIYNWIQIGQGSRLHSEFGSNISDVKLAKAPNVADFLNIKDLPEEAYIFFKEHVTAYSPGFYVPTNSPEKILFSRYPEDVATNILGLREQPNVDVLSLSSTYEFDEETTNFFTSNNLSITIQASYEKVTYTKTIVIALDPYAALHEPVVNVLFEKN